MDNQNRDRPVGQQQHGQLRQYILQIAGTPCLVLCPKRLPHGARSSLCTRSFQRTRHTPQDLGLRLRKWGILQRLQPLFDPRIPQQQTRIGLGLQAGHLGGHLRL